MHFRKLFGNYRSDSSQNRRKWASRFVGVVSIAVSLFWLPVSVYAQHDFTIDGHFLCRDSSGAPKPIVGARVEFWHNYVGGTIEFDTTQVAPRVYTDSTGFFSSANIHGDDVTNYYAKIVLNDDVGGESVGARLHQPYTGGSEYYVSPLADDSKGNAHFEVTLNDDQGTSAPVCAIWQNAHDSYDEYRKVTGGLPPSPDYDIWMQIATGTPWTTRGTTNWPFNSVPRRARSEHEFGHSIRHSLDGDVTEFYLDVVKFKYARSHSACDVTNEGFAFNEGWAEYWATPWSASPDCGDPKNTEREGVVAIALDNLSRCDSVGRAGMVDVLRDNPGSIHSLQEFFAAFQRKFPALHPEMFNGCLTAPRPFGEGFSGDSVESAEATVQKLLARREQSLSKALRNAQIASRRSRNCAEPACLPQAFDDVVKPFALQSEIERTRLLASSLSSAANQLGSEDATFNRSLDDPARALEFDQRNLDMIADFAGRALQATKPLVERDHSGTLSRKAHELSQGIAQMKISQQKTPPQTDSPRLSLAEETAYPLPPHVPDR
jgi:hypothetical protein